MVRGGGHGVIWSEVVVMVLYEQMWWSWCYMSRGGGHGVIWSEVVVMVLYEQRWWSWCYMSRGGGVISIQMDKGNMEKKYGYRYR